MKNKPPDAGKFIDSIYECKAPQCLSLVQFSSINETNLCFRCCIMLFPKYQYDCGTRFSNSCQKTNCLSLSGCAADIIPIWEHGQMVIDFIPGKDGTRLCLDCTQHLAVWMAELFCHFSARAHSSTHWYSCSYYPPQSAAEELWLMATVRAISQWFIKQDWHE